jgi:hypothetical protein
MEDPVKPWSVTQSQAKRINEYNFSCFFGTMGCFQVSINRRIWVSLSPGANLPLLSSFFLHLGALPLH